MATTPHSYGIVFSGGGAFGAWEVGCYQAIKSRHKGDAPVVVTGASAGALNAAGVCANMDVSQLARLWADINDNKVYRNTISERLTFSRWELLKLIGKQRRINLAAEIARRFLTENRSLFETAPLQETLHKIFEGSVWQSFVQSRISFAISVTNLMTKKKEIFYKLPSEQSLPEAAERQSANTVWTSIGGADLLVQALMGSTALPILFPPFGIYFDGGVALNQPISPALGLASPQILYVVIPTAKVLGTTDNISQIGTTLLETWLSASLLSQIEKIRLQNRIKTMSNRGKGQGPNDQRTRICVIRPPQDLGRVFSLSIISFGSKVADMVAAGVIAATNRMDSFNYDDNSENSWYDS